MKQRYAELGKLKSLLFRTEIKNRRVSKIKAKLYHKIKKRDREREEKKLRDHLELIDPEAAQAIKDKEDLKMVEERLRVRHGAQSKFAKNLKRFQSMDDKGTRDAYHQAIQERNALVHRTQKKRGGDSDSDDSMDEGDSMSSESGQDVDMKKQKDKSNALKRIQAEIGSESASESVDESGESEMSEEGEENGKSFKMDFGDKKQTNNKSSKDKKTGIMGLKFMERAQAKEKEALKA